MGGAMQQLQGVEYLIEESGGPVSPRAARTGLAQLQTPQVRPLLDVTSLSCLVSTWATKNSTGCWEVALCLEAWSCSG